MKFRQDIRAVRDVQVIPRILFRRVLVSEANRTNFEILRSPMFQELPV